MNLRTVVVTWKRLALSFTSLFTSAVSEKLIFCVFAKATQVKRRTRCVADIQFISAFAQPFMLLKRACYYCCCSYVLITRQSFNEDFFGWLHYFSKCVMWHSAIFWDNETNCCAMCWCQNDEGLKCLKHGRWLCCSCNLMAASICKKGPKNMHKTLVQKCRHDHHFKTR